MREVKQDPRAFQHTQRANYWFQGVDEMPEGVYHEVLYRQGYQSSHCHCCYWGPFFSPQGYGYRFDAFANVLVSLFEVADDSQGPVSITSFLIRLLGRRNFCQRSIP